ncbi:MAG: flagellar basal body-associated FliL family protein [Woeseiaceae bacterium]|nr:flagellar basal body-associated FliL family protein [Woeseiaceae bacterium]
MADEAVDTPEEAPEANGGGMLKILALGGGAVVLLAVGIFAGPAVMNMISPPAEEATEAAPEPGSGPALYTSLHPPIVVNFKDEAGEQHYMQITMEVMARDQGVINSVREHVAVIRNALILLYSGVTYEEVVTHEGKEKMLADGLEAIREVMTEIGGEPGVEAVYFTNLVIQ